MKLKTSCEIATIAALVHFGKNPEDGLAWIEEIYNATRREAAAHTTPVNLDPVVNAAIDLGQEVEKEKRRGRTLAETNPDLIAFPDFDKVMGIKKRKTKAKKTEKPQKSKGGR